MKKSRLVPGCLLALAFFSGCVMNNSAVRITNITPKALEAPVYGEELPEAHAAAKGANDFAFRLSAALAKETEEANLICSPYSVWLPLAALVNATKDQSKPQLLEALGVGGIEEAALNQAASRMLYDLTNQRDKDVFTRLSEKKYINDPLKMANALFVDPKVTPKKHFTQAFADSYRGTVMHVNFTDQSAVQAVNQWASKHTDGLITDLVETFEPNSVAVIANALYFSDRWHWEFQKDLTKEDVFYGPSGETRGAYMLREGSGMLYYEDAKLQAIPLAFKSDSGMYILLPKDGDANGLLASMTNRYFEEIQENSAPGEGKLLLPRFSVKSDVMPLKDTLKSLGIPLFDAQLAPLSGGLLEEALPVYLSNAIQKAMIEVDEKGTTAAAVTVMEVDAGSAIQEEPEPTVPFLMNCNRPFVFILYGNTYDGGRQILFTGIINQPDLP